MRLLIVVILSFWSVASFARDVNCPGTYFKNIPEQTMRGTSSSDVGAQAASFCQSEGFQDWSAIYIDTLDAQGNNVKDANGNWLYWLEDVFCTNGGKRNDVKYRKTIIENRKARGEHLGSNADAVVASAGDKNCVGYETVDKSQQSSEAAAPAKRAPASPRKAKSH